MGAGGAAKGFAGAAGGEWGEWGAANGLAWAGGTKGLAVLRGAGAGAGSGFVEAFENATAFPDSNGLLMSSGTSTCFCTRRRAISAGLIRESNSPSGKGTETLSLSVSELKAWGAVWRNSPKEILTEPRESCESTRSRGM